jgi:hypothetical protein
MGKALPHRSELGANLGPKVARVVVDAMVDHLHKSKHLRADIHKAGLDRFFAGMEAETHVHTAPFFKAYTDHPDLPPELAQAMRFIADGHGEASQILHALSVGQATAMGILSGVSNYLAPVNQRLIAAQPNTLLAPEQLAAASVRGLFSHGGAVAEAARGGINTERFDLMVQLAYAFPGLPEVLELLRRGHIDRGEATNALEREGVHPAWIGRLLQMQRVILAPPDLALMELRGIIDTQTAHAIGAQSGVDAEDMDRLTLATGEPPGAESLMEGLRRGFIDRERFAHGIRQSRIRNEWIGFMEQLRFEPMATAEAVEAVVRNYIPSAEGQKIAEQNGLEPAHWHVLLEAHGRPPGHDQMLQLQRRGLASQQQVDQAVRESDIKDKYVPTLRGLLHKLPAERLVVSLVQHGALSEAEALQLLEHEGYAPNVARAIVHSGMAQRTAGHKQVAQSMVLELYEAHAIDKARASSMIVALGYPATDVPLILATIDLKRELKWREQAVGSIRAAFLARKVDHNEAAAELGAAGIPSGQVDYLLRLWGIELRGHRRLLTEAQIMHGHRQGHVNAADTETRLVDIGYDHADARFLIATAGPLPRHA